MVLAWPAELYSCKLDNWKLFSLLMLGHFLYSPSRDCNGPPNHQGPPRSDVHFFYKAKNVSNDSVRQSLQILPVLPSTLCRKKEPHRELKSSGSQQTVCKVYIYFTLYYASADVSSDLI